MLQKFKFLVLTLMMGASLQAAAQKGTISGHIADKITGEDVIGASVFLEGTTIGAATDINGNFQFSADAGTHNLVVTYVGYKKLVTPVTVTAGQDLKVTLALESDDQHLEEVVVKAQADKTSESVLLMDRKKSIDIVQGIGAMELSRKGVTDAEAAVTQVTGVSKQQGVKNVFVRGLGDRYNSTTLNGLPLPSEDPEYKNITLNFFSTNIISNIDVNKTFNARIPGDVAGANINIVSKQLFDEREFMVSGSLGVNSQAVSNDFYKADGNNFLGTTEKNIPISNLSRYTFSNSFAPVKYDGPIVNPSLSLSGGRTFSLGNNSLRVFAVAAMTGDYTYKKGKAAQTNTEGDFRQDLDYKKYEYNASQFALANVSYGFGKGNSIGYNAIYIHDSKQSVAEYSGFSINAVDDITMPNAYDNLIRRQQTNNNVLLVNQLTGEFTLSDKLSLDVRGSFNTVRGDEPDRRQNFWIGDGSGESYRPNANSPAFNHRFFSTLKETELAGITTATYALGGENKIMAGYSFRSTARDFDFTQFNFDTQNASVTVDPMNPDAYYNQQGINNNVFDLETSRGTGSDALEPFFYTGDRTIHGGFVNFVYELSPKFSVNAGMRVETLHQKVRWSTGADEIRPNIPGDNTVIRDKTYFLPSLNLKYELSENDQLRFSSSMSYTFPQFKELAPFLYEDVNSNRFGNPELVPAKNINVDVKYEHYFGAEGLIAITGFYKNIQNSINMVQVNSAALEFSYLNTGDANVVGAELEFRKNLLDLSGGKNESVFSTGVNVSYLYSVQKLENDPSSTVQFTPTDKTSALEGASPLLINTDLTFTKNGNNGRKISSAVVLNYFSRRIYSLGVSGQNSIYERGIPTLDFINKIDLNHRMSLSLNVRNLLNPEYRMTKEIHDTGKNDLIGSYRRGVTTSVGFSYRF